MNFFEKLKLALEEEIWIQDNREDSGEAWTEPFTEGLLCALEKAREIDKAEQAEDGEEFEVKLSLSQLSED